MLRSWWHCYLWHILRTAPQPSWCHVNNSTPSGRHVNNSSTCWHSVSLQTKEHEKVIHGVSLWWVFIPSVMMRVLIKVTQQGFMILVQGKEVEPQCIKRGSARCEEDEASEEETWATTWWAHTRRVRISSDSFYITPKQPKAPFHFYLGTQSPSTSVLALGVTFPAVPIEALPPALAPLPVAPPVAVVTTPGFVAMADPDDAFCNAPKSSTFIIAHWIHVFAVSWQN